MEIKILVVDDNRDTIRMYIKALQRKVKPQNEDKLDVDFADTYYSAIEKLNNNHFDLLVVDLRIPGLEGNEWGGFDIIKESAKLDKLRPVIVLSGYGSLENLRKSFREGILDFIEKSNEAVEELILLVQKAINDRYVKILRAGNPFNPGMSQPSIFGGRSNELGVFESKLYRAIHSQKYEHFVVLGQWGIGKSSLLKEYQRICRSRGYATTLVPLEPLQQDSSTMDAARSLVEGILRGLPFPVNQPSFTKLVDFFDSVGINFLGSGLQFTRRSEEVEISVQAFLHDFLIKLWEDISSRTELLVILVDELENFMPVPEVIMLLRSTLSMESLKGAKIIVGIATTKDSWVDFITPKKHHPLARFFLSTVELNSLSKNEVSEVIKYSLANTGIRFSEEVIEEVFNLTNGHPFEMQLLCYHLFDNQLEGYVDLDASEKALRSSLNDIGGAVFESWLSQLDDDEHQVLRAICSSSKPISIAAMKDGSNSINDRTSFGFIEEQLNKLLEKKVIAKRRSESVSLYYCSDPMFKAYFLSVSDK